jgi:hypothetical protein
MKSKILKLILVLSILLNMCLILIILYQALDGCAKIADGRIGAFLKMRKLVVLEIAKQYLHFLKGLSFVKHRQPGQGGLNRIGFKS